MCLGVWMITAVDIRKFISWIRTRRITFIVMDDTGRLNTTTNHRDGIINIMVDGTMYRLKPVQRILIETICSFIQMEE